MSSDDARRKIDVGTGVVMALGATLSVYLHVTHGVPEGTWVIVSNYQLVLYGAIGAFPGWILNGMLKRQLTPETHGEAETKQPRCKECGAILAQWGERCPDCRAFTPR